MKIPFYQVDAFTNKLFGGNPAGVCPLDEWLPDDILKNIAMENNLSETSFFVKEKDNYRIRWITPTVEVDLCGHATLAASHVLFNHLNYPEKIINFLSRSGELIVRKENNFIVLNFPVEEIKQVTVDESLYKGIGIKPTEAYKSSSDLLLVYGSQSEIEKIIPQFDLINTINARGVIVTAKGDKVDFVSRFFGPQVGVPEDPVTGSAHTKLIPYWSEKLGKKELSAVQVSKRRGELKCKYLNDRVEIAGEAVTYLMGYIEI